MAIQIVKRKNFFALLPVDYYALKSIVRLDNNKPLSCINYPWQYSNPDEQCMIGVGRIYFSGHYSEWLILKWVQKLKDRLFPVKYKLEYFSINETKTGY